MKVIKKDGTHEGYDFMKIKNAVTKSAKRVMIDLDDEAFDRLKDIVELRLSLLNTELIPIADMHNVVEESLEQFDPRIAKSYKDYRNYKKDFVHMMDKVYQKSQSIRFIGDKENANTDSTLVATKRCLIFNDLNKRLYRKFFMTQEELEIRSFLSELSHNHGITIFISSHVLSEIEQIADIIGVMHEGHLVEEVNISELHKRNRKYIQFDLSDSEIAGKILENHYHMTDFTVQDGTVRIYDFSQSVGEINREFARNGLLVTRINDSEENLEDYFSKLIGGGGIA